MTVRKALTVLRQLRQLRQVGHNLEPGTREWHRVERMLRRLVTSEQCAGGPADVSLDHPQDIVDYRPRYAGRRFQAALDRVSPSGCVISGVALRPRQIGSFSGRAKSDVARLRGVIDSRVSMRLH